MQTSQPRQCHRRWRLLRALLTPPGRLPVGASVGSAVRLREQRPCAVTADLCAGVLANHPACCAGRDHGGHVDRWVICAPSPRSCRLPRPHGDASNAAIAPVGDHPGRHDHACRAAAHHAGLGVGAGTWRQRVVAGCGRRRRRRCRIRIRTAERDGDRRRGLCGEFAHPVSCRGRRAVPFQLLEQRAGRQIGLERATPRTPPAASAPPRSSPSPVPPAARASGRAWCR